VVEFLFGVLAAEIHLRLLKNRNGLSKIRCLKSMRLLPVLLISSGTAALLSAVWTSPPLTLRCFAYGLPALLIVSGAAMFESAPRPRFLVYLGDASYSVYLTHTFAATAFFLALGRISALGAVPPDVVILVGGIMTIAACSLTYLLVERPLTQLFLPKKVVCVDKSSIEQSPIFSDSDHMPTEKQITIQP
jgi:peptidoglycan/LPS O-acetylase OafA/YrhL